MRYRMRKPPVAVVPSRDVKAKPSKPATPDSALPADPQRSEEVAKAFVAYFGRLEALLGDRWLGAWDTVAHSSASLGNELTHLEARADALAFAWVHHAADELEFRRALEGLEKGWTCAARFLDRIAGLSANTACDTCSKSEAKSMIVEDDGTVLCSRCLRYGLPRQK